MMLIRSLNMIQKKIEGRKKEVRRYRACYRHRNGFSHHGRYHTDQRTSRLTHSLHPVLTCFLRVPASHFTSTSLNLFHRPHQGQNAEMGRRCEYAAGNWPLEADGYPSYLILTNPTRLPALFIACSTNRERLAPHIRADP